MLIDTLKRKIEDIVELALEDMSFEELLEQFDISAHEAFYCLFSNGLIDPELLEEMYGVRSTD